MEGSGSGARRTGDSLAREAATAKRGSDRLGRNAAGSPWNTDATETAAGWASEERRSFVAVGTNTAADRRRMPGRRIEAATIGPATAHSRRRAAGTERGDRIHKSQDLRVE
jgi:hypothetical protein